MLAVRSQRHGAEWPSAEKRTAAAPRDPNGAARAHYGRSQLPVVLLGPSPSATVLFHKLCSSFTSFSCVLFSFSFSSHSPRSSIEGRARAAYAPAGGSRRGRRDTLPGRTVHHRFRKVQNEGK